MSDVDGFEDTYAKWLGHSFPSGGRWKPTAELKVDLALIEEGIHGVLVDTVEAGRPYRISPSLDVDAVLKELNDATDRAARYSEEASEEDRPVAEGLRDYAELLRDLWTDFKDRIESDQNADATIQPAGDPVIRFERRSLIASFLRLQRPLDEIVVAMWGSPWLGEEDSVELTPEAAAAILKRAADGELSQADLKMWADIVGFRPDIKYAKDSHHALQALVQRFSDPGLSPKQYEKSLHTWTARLNQD